MAQEQCLVTLPSHREFKAALGCSSGKERPLVRCDSRLVLGAPSDFDVLDVRRKVRAGNERAEELPGPPVPGRGVRAVSDVDVLIDEALSVLAEAAGNTADAEEGLETGGGVVEGVVGAVDNGEDLVDDLVWEILEGCHGYWVWMDG